MRSRKIGKLLCNPLSLSQRLGSVMHIKTMFVSVLIGVLCGCSQDRFKKGSGDVGQFIIQQANIRGGLCLSTNGLPPILGRWSYSEDEQGIIIQTAPNQYPAIESLLRQTFGEPRFLGDTTDGGKLGGYRLTTKGGAIQFGYNPERTQVIIIRPLSQKEFEDGLMKAMQDDKFWKNLTNR
jgi:hypothetical protein